MGRAERRRMERNKRIESRKDKILMSTDEVIRMKRQITEEATDYKVEALMTCFALANRRLYGHGTQRTMRTLQYIDDLMEAIITGEKSIDDYKKEVEDEVNVVISCN